jgi:hypothetical protein
MRVEKCPRSSAPLAAASAEARSRLSLPVAAAHGSRDQLPTPVVATRGEEGRDFTCR